jgi:2-oxoglutarate ferredoxin oxidoreductase subunit gamma
MPRKDIRIAGFGGQGIILAGHILGKAAAVHEGANASLTQSYGPESRGGACSAQVVVSDEPILYPHLLNVEILAVMSKEACTKFQGALKKGFFLYDTDLVKPDPLPDEVKSYGIPATRFAEELGRSLVANIVMLGFVTAVTKVVTFESMKKAVLATVPKGTEQLNEKALTTGYEHGLEQVGDAPAAVSASAHHEGETP